MTSPIAAQLYTIRDFMKTAEDFAASMTRIKAIGYENVQLSGLGPIDPKDVAAVLRGEGLNAVITHVGRDRLFNDLDALIEEHHLWQCPNVAVGSMPLEAMSTPDGIAESARQLSDVARKLKAAGLTFSYHNHSFEFVKVDGKNGLQAFYDAADPLVLAEFDVYWVQHGGGDPADWITRFGSRQVVTHFKDMVVVDNKPTMAEVGEGNLNWPRIIEACRAAGVQYFAVEQDVCRRDPFESLRISYNNLKAMGV
jgi:sugar phosphate isomerase/epimerase